MNVLSYNGAICTFFCETIAKHHDFNLKRLTKVEAERFILFIELATFEKYPELNGAQENLIEICKSESSKRVNHLKNLLNDETNSYFELSFS